MALTATLIKMEETLKKRFFKQVRLIFDRALNSLTLFKLGVTG